MNESEVKLAGEKLKSQLKTFKCPICQTESEFDFESSEFQIIGFQRDETTIIANSNGTANANYIQAMVNVCPHCGFVALFNFA